MKTILSLLLLCSSCSFPIENYQGQPAGQPYKNTPASNPTVVKIPALQDDTTDYSTASTRHCNKGKPCGNSCISVNKVCRK